jgi:hypothetical protein
LYTGELKRPVLKAPEMMDVIEFPPPVGNNLLAISIGGKLCEVVWKRGDEDHFVSWMSYPKIPAKSKKRMHDLYFSGWRT